MGLVTAIVGTVVICIYVYLIVLAARLVSAVERIVTTLGRCAG